MLLIQLINSNHEWRSVTGAVGHKQAAEEKLAAMRSQMAEAASNAEIRVAEMEAGAAHRYQTHRRVLSSDVDIGSCFCKLTRTLAPVLVNLRGPHSSDAFAVRATAFDELRDRIDAGARESREVAQATTAMKLTNLVLSVY